MLLFVFENADFIGPHPNAVGSGNQNLHHILALPTNVFCVRRLLNMDV